MSNAENPTKLYDSNRFTTEFKDRQSEKICGPSEITQAALIKLGFGYLLTGVFPSVNTERTEDRYVLSNDPNTVGAEPYSVNIKVKEDGDVEYSVPNSSAFGNKEYTLERQALRLFLGIQNLASCAFDPNVLKINYIQEDHWPYITVAFLDGRPIVKAKQGRDRILDITTFAFGPEEGNSDSGVIRWGVPKEEDS